MTVAAQPTVTWSQFGRNPHSWVVSGVFQGSATYTGEFHDRDELGRFLDFLLADPHQPATSRLYLHERLVPRRSELDLSNLRFQFDPALQVAAAVMVVVDRNANKVLSWMTRGDAGRDDVVLSHDSWGSAAMVFPPESFITVGQLRQVVLEWAFDEVQPPPEVKWVAAPDVGWF